MKSITGVWDFGLAEPQESEMKHVEGKFCDLINTIYEAKIAGVMHVRPPGSGTHLLQVSLEVKDDDVNRDLVAKKLGEYRWNRGFRVTFD